MRSLMVIFLAVTIAVVSCDKIDSSGCGEYGASLKEVAEAVKRNNNELASFRLVKCVAGYDPAMKRTLINATYNANENECTIVLEASELEYNSNNSGPIISKFQQQAKTCMTTANQAQQPVDKLNTTPSTSRVIEPEHDSKDWKMLARAFTKFILNDLIELRVLSTQNVEKYTHAEDDGHHLRLILLVNGLRCELQIYKHPSHEGSHARVVHADGPHRSVESHFIRGREDRKFGFPNCAILYATEKTKKQIAEFMGK